MSHNQFKMSFTLKQHTPIIHFQSEQSGATLRATELKPKFDRFLLQNAKDIPYKKSANGDKFIDYKVKIIAENSKSEIIEETNRHNGKEIPDPLFFGNMGDGERKKFTIADKIKIEFFSLNAQIIKVIEDKFEAFLAQTNFGTRQSKGFGSFYPYDEATKKNKPFNKSLIPYAVYSFNSTNWKHDIKLLYQFLRQGINLPNREGTRFYSKPAIFSYAVKNGWTWDKKAIKAHFFSDDLRAQQAKHNDANSPVNFKGDNAYLLRDLFGLSSDQKWGSYRTDIKKEHKEIERFKSPVTFKVVDGQVYFWADSSVEKILNKTFKISAKGNRPLDLSTPKEFSFDAFFAFVKTIDLSKHIDSKYHKESEFKTLSIILNGIKSSK